MKRRSVLLLLAFLPVTATARRYGPGPKPGPTSARTRKVRTPKGRRDLRDDRRELRSDMRDADSRSDVRGAKNDYRKNRRDSVWH